MTIAKAPPRPTPEQKLEISMRAMPEHWFATGRMEARPGWFGVMVLLIEESRRVHRQVALNPSPLNWRVEHRWRRARRWEVVTVVVGLADRERVG